MIFAKVDVELRDHVKAARAGSAMGTWLWALLWTRAKELDGFVAAEALRGSWVGIDRARKDLQKLVEVGLAEVSDGGWTLLGYAERNETREDIRKRRESAIERKARSRGRNTNVSRVTDASDAPVTDVAVTLPDPDPEPEPEPEPEPDQKKEIPPTPRRRPKATPTPSPALTDRPDDGPQSDGTGPRTLFAVPDAPEAPPERKTRPRAIPGAWEPASDLVARIAQKHELAERDVLARVEPFRDYWLSTGKPKSDWDATFRVWIGREVDEGRLVPRPRPYVPEPEPPDNRTPEQIEAGRRWFADCMQAVAEGRTPPLPPAPPPDPEPGRASA